MLDVAIIGAGAAGIGAARTLHAAGRSIAVVEAGDRVGGRAHTLAVGGMALDLGCGWLHSAGRNPWVGIAEAAGFAVDRSRPAWGKQYRDLGFPPGEQAAAAAAFDRFEQRLRNDPPPGDRAADALEPGGRWNAWLDAMSGYINGADLSALSVSDYLAYDEAATEDNWRLPDGYGALVAASLPPVPLHLASAVRRVEETANVVRLHTDRGTIDAGAVIVTVSTAVLAAGGVALPPAFDDAMQAATRLPLGLADKLFLRLPEDHGIDADSHLLGNPHLARTGSYYLRPFGREVIECFFGGSGARALEAEGLDGAAAFAKAELGALLGRNLADRLTLLAGSAWGKADGFGGSYSHACPGHADARAVLAMRRHDRILIAGEATSPTDFSTAHGALQSGIAAADALLAR
ncbi:NAD(P)/FAD-dependent oxidoreductase [Sphingomonas sp. VNH70]|uniref:flavin monoamine oxidase family protein n=1 Tax=Sphingomonas silueang TaxID=3156617 RepID=UPI0032B601E2